MAEYIEREALKELVKKHFKLAIDAGMHSLDVVDTACAMTSLIDGVDKADVAEVRHGRWIDRPTVKGQVYCSECATIEKVTDSNYKSQYCPNCGARMDLGGANNA